MNRTARRITTSAAATAVTLAMAAPGAVAHDRGGSHDGDRDGYSSGYDRDRNRLDGDRDGWDGDRVRWDGDRDGWDGWDGDRDRWDGDRDRHDGDRARWDGDRADRDDDDGYRSERSDLGDRDGVRHARSGRFRDSHKTGARGLEVSFAQQKRAMLAYLDRADAFLAELSNRVSSSELDPSLKSTLLEVVANRQATIANLRQQVQAASTPEDLKSLRHSAHADKHL